MLRLGSIEGWLGGIVSDDAADPRPFLLPAVRVRFAPIGIKAVRAARRAVAKALAIDVDDIEEAGDELSRELLRRGILEWEGVGDADGKPVAVSPDTIALFMADPTCFEAADRVYVRPWSDRELEKNGFAGSRNGTSATPANDIASGSADTSPTADASPTRKARRSKPGKAARTSRSST